MKIENSIVLGDCLDVLPNIPDKSFDLIIIDPLFIIANYYSLRIHVRKSFGDLGLIEHFFKNLFREFERILKDSAYFYVFCNGDSYPLFWYYTFPFTKRVRTVIWDRGTSINGYSWGHQHNLILFGEMPNTIKVPTGDGDIIKCRGVPIKKRKHPAQKPIELLKKLISKSSKENDLVGNFFCSLGSTLLAAKQLNRKYFGIEYDNNYFKIIKENLANVKQRPNIKQKPNLKQLLKQ